MNGLTPYPITPIGNFIGFILALLPLILQIRKLSLAVWAYSIWIAVICFEIFVDTIIWHNNDNIVVPVWCDIETKLELGVGVGTRACALVICIHLYKIARTRPSVGTAKDQRRKTMVYELLLIVGFPFLVMALSIITQPARFEIIEEVGCAATVYSYVGYIITYGPNVIFSLGCVIFAPLTLCTFLRHRAEMNEFLSSNGDMTHNKYNRLMIIACLDTFINLPVLVTIVVTEIVRGKASPLNYPYISWKNVHDNEGGNIPGVSLSTIEQATASDRSASAWGVFSIKWNEWLYVLHAITFFLVFGTTPEMRRYYRSVFWFIPERLGYKRQRVSEVETVSDVAFNSNPGRQTETRFTTNSFRGSLSFPKAEVDKSATHSGEGNDLESGMTTAGTRVIATVAFVEGDESHAADGR